MKNLQFDAIKVYDDLYKAERTRTIVLKRYNKTYHKLLVAWGVGFYFLLKAQRMRVGIEKKERSNRRKKNVEGVSDGEKKKSSTSLLSKQFYSIRFCLMICKTMKIYDL